MDTPSNLSVYMHYQLQKPLTRPGLAALPPDLAKHYGVKP